MVTRVVSSLYLPSLRQFRANVFAGNFFPLHASDWFDVYGRSNRK
jgi:hypothetical protein